jgi:hypothetical protein
MDVDVPGGKMMQLQQGRQVRWEVDARDEEAVSKGETLSVRGKEGVPWLREEADGGANRPIPVRQEGADDRRHVAAPLRVVKANLHCLRAVHVVRGVRPFTCPGAAWLRSS